MWDGFNGSPATGRIISYSFAQQNFSQNRVYLRRNTRFCSQDSCNILVFYFMVICRTPVIKIGDQQMGQNLRLVLFSFTISNIKRYRVGESKHNTLLRCKVSQGRRHVSALYYKAIIRSDKVKTKEEITMLHIAYIHSML